MSEIISILSENTDNVNVLRQISSISDMFRSSLVNIEFFEEKKTSENLCKNTCRTV